jgi:hypothetical protein
MTAAYLKAQMNRRLRSVATSPAVVPATAGKKWITVSIEEMNHLASLTG